MFRLPLTDRKPPRAARSGGSLKRPGLPPGRFLSGNMQSYAGWRRGKADADATNFSNFLQRAGKYLLLSDG